MISGIFRGIIINLSSPIHVRHLSRTCGLLEKAKSITVTVNSFCKINVNVSSDIEIRPYDLLDCPEANLIKATADETLLSTIKVDTSQFDSKGQQEVVISDQFGGIGGKIVLEIPIKSDLNVECSESVSLRDFHSDDITINCLKNIIAKNLKSRNIYLHSNNGNIVCDGTILAKFLQIQSDNAGHIKMDKIMGDNLTIQANEGAVSINSCYSENSKIKTNSGRMDLRNIHRNCEVNVDGYADVDMVGFNGNLLATINNGSFNCQLSELQGESVIVANNQTDFTLNLSEEVIKSTYIHASVNPDKLQMDPDLEKRKVVKEETGAIILNQKDVSNKLFIQTLGNVSIQKLSWADSIKMKF